MNQFILGGGDPVLAGTQIDEQIQLLEGQKQLLMARQRQLIDIKRVTKSSSLYLYIPI